MLVRVQLVGLLMIGDLSPECVRRSKRSNLLSLERPQRQADIVEALNDLLQSE